MMEAELEYKEIWNGEHRGIRFEVVHWRLGWNYYLFIPVEQLPEDIGKVFNLQSKTTQLTPESIKRIHHEYTDAPVVSDLDWHGGITLYEKERESNGKLIGFKLGCDYMHSFDKAHDYTLDYVEKETRHSIDKLWELVPNLKLCCAWNGKYYPQKDIFYTDKGVCVAMENKEKWYKPIS